MTLLKKGEIRQGYNMRKIPKYFIIAIIFFVFFTILSFYFMDLFGIISLKALGEEVIINTPFLKEYVATNEQYEEVLGRRQELELLVGELKEENEKLKNDLEQVQENIKQKEEEVDILKEQLKFLEDFRQSREERLDRLVEIYSNMEPEAAAPIFISLEKQISLLLLSNLDEEHAARILTRLPPEKAAELSQELEN